MKGFFIKKVSVVGETKKSEIEFTLGLNVITGPSNTGKSFLFQCIDYMFGKQDLKDIDELNGYKYIFLEISTYEDKKFTLKRLLNTNDIFVCDGPINEWNDESAERKNIKHSAKDNNISTFLLDLMGIPSSVNILSNQSGNKQALSFRSLSEWFIIDENIMISNDELLLGNYKSSTPKQSTLLYVLDGLTYDLKKKVDSDEVVKAKISGEIDVSERNLDKNRERQEELINLLKNVSSNLNENKLEEYKQELSDLQIKINISNKKVIELRKEYEKTNNSVNIKLQQLSKFEKLKKQYCIDIDRLLFIKENSEKLIKLKSYMCPLCGNEMKKELDTDVLDACYAETYNIRINLNELEELSTEIDKEKIELENHLIILNNDIIKAEHGILECYNKIKPLKFSVDEYIKQKQLEIELQNLKISEQRIDEDVKSKKEDYKNIKGIKIKPAESPVSEKRKKFILFLEEMFKEVDNSITSIKLTGSLLDIEINGKDRRNNGKGYRAFYKSLYFYALVLFKLNDDNYTKLLILDSPLTSFKEERGDKVNEEISHNLQYNFIKKISAQKNIQIIVFENKEIPDDLKNKVNLITFTKNDEIGRYGFLE